MLRVIDGKGGRNREVQVAQQMIQRLRGYWCFIAMRAGSSLVLAAAGKSAHPPCRLPWRPSPNRRGRSPARGCKEARNRVRAAASTLPESGSFRVQ
jgi:hypothetical protein